MKKIDYEEKAIKGTARLDKMRKSTMLTTSKMPRPVLKLTKHGTKIYKDICEHLVLHDLLCKVDSYYISVAAHQFGIYHAMSEMIDELESAKIGSGMFVTFSSGVVQNSTYLNAMNKAFDNFEKACKNLGLQVKGRDSITAFSKKGAEDGEPDDEFGLKTSGRRAPQDGRPSAAHD